MRTLIVGVGALGGLIAVRMGAAGCPVWLATRDAALASALKQSGLKLTGVGGAVSAEVSQVAPLAEYLAGPAFDLIVLATKAHEAIDVAPSLVALLSPGGTLLPIQNGGVPQMLADRLGSEYVLGGLSNFGATMTTVGAYEQRNAGHFLIGEFSGGVSGRADRVRQWLGQGVEVRMTPNLQGAAWSKLLLNCSVTTLGALAGRSMREYIASPEGRQVFDRTYDEALSVALAMGVRLERMVVEPMPPSWNGRSVAGEAHESWIGEILAGYGDLKASMLQDFERRRKTEIDFINGYVANLGARLGVRTPANAAIVEVVHAIERGEMTPNPAILGEILETSGSETDV